MDGFVFTMKSPDLQKISASLLQNAEKVQAKLDAKILSDCNYFCPLDKGQLQKSGIIHSVIGSGRLIWRAPYARKQYYTPYKHNKSRNPNATMKWCESAKARHLKEWIALVKSEMAKA